MATEAFVQMTQTSIQTLTREQENLRNRVSALDNTVPAQRNALSNQQDEIVALGGRVKKTEETIISFIQSHYPEHMILGEEGGVITSSSGGAAAGDGRGATLGADVD